MLNKYCLEWRREEKQGKSKNDVKRWCFHDFELILGIADWSKKVFEYSGSLFQIKYWTIIMGVMRLMGIQPLKPKKL